MKKILMLLIFSFAFCASLPTVPHEFESRKIIPANWLNDNFTSANASITDGTKKINVAEVEINGETFIDGSGTIFYTDIDVSNNATIENVSADIINCDELVSITANFDYLDATTISVDLLNVSELYNDTSISLETPALTVSGSMLGQYEEFGTFNVYYTATYNMFVCATVLTPNSSGSIAFNKSVGGTIILESFTTGNSRSVVLPVGTGEQWQVQTSPVSPNGTIYTVRMF